MADPSIARPTAKIMKAITDENFIPRHEIVYNHLMKTMPLREKAIGMLECLPEDKLKKVVDYLKYLEGDYDTFDVNANIKQSLNEVKLMKEGKIKPKTLKELLREL